MPDWRLYVRNHLPALRVSPERESEIARELALQLEQAYSDALAAGLTDAEALDRACSQVRDWDRLAREIDDAERPAPKPDNFTGALHDVRHAFRFIRRNPLLAIVAVLTLAFGIGANTAIFTIVDAIALRSLPYEQPDRLMAIETRRTSQPEIEPWSSALDFFDLRERARSFTKLAGISPIWNVVMTGRGEAQRLEALYVSAEFFPLLGARPSRGRLFVAEDDNRTHPANVVILSHAFWQKEFGGSPDALGKSVALDSGAYTIIGILPPDFRYLGEPLAGTATSIDVWFPLAANQLIDRHRAGEGIPGIERRVYVERLAAERSDYRSFTHYVVPATRSRGLRSADGLCERGALAARQGRREAERSGGPSRSGSFPVPALAAPALRGCGARLDRSRSRRRTGAGAAKIPDRRGTRRSASNPCHQTRPPCAVIYSVRRHPQRDSIRTSTGLASGPLRDRDGVAPGRPRHDRGTSSSESGPGRSTGRTGAGPAGRSGPADPQFRATARRESGFRFSPFADPLNAATQCGPV
jgi:MacB-like periplasmic core domain